jgi:HK97 family phage major capsid protein
MDDLTELRSELDELSGTIGALGRVEEVKTAAASDPVLDELCEPGALETKSARPVIQTTHGTAISREALREIGKAAIKAADAATGTHLGGSNPITLAKGIIAGLRAAPENKALRRPGLAAARERRDQTYKTFQRTRAAGESQLMRRATVEIGKKLLALEKRMSRAEVKGDRPPGSRLPSLPGYHGAASRMTGAKALHHAAVINFMRTGEKQFNGHHIDELQRMAFGRKDGMFGESNPSGGYLLMTERGNPLDAAITEMSPLRQYATVRQITAGEFEQPVNKKGTKAYWRSEREPRPDTETPELGLDKFPAMELEACPQATQRLLDDVTSFDPEAWLAGEVTQAFAEAESDAFVNENGVEKPRGLLTYPLEFTHANWAHGKFRAVKTGVNGDFPATDDDAAALLLDVQYSIKPAYMPNCVWWMARSTAAKIRKLRDQQGRFLWQEGLAQGQPPTLLGHPVVLDEYCPAIGSGTTSLGFLDIARTYLIVDRLGVRVLRDPFTNAPWVKFRTTKRVGGAVQMFDAACFLQFSV